MEVPKRKRSRNEWDYAKDEILIELVRQKPALYDVKSPKYSDNDVKRNTWIDIGRRIKKSGKDCKTRWESLRAQFRKRLNKKKAKKGVAAYQDAEWKYEEHMRFLKDFMKDRGHIESILWDEDEDFDEISSDVPESAPVATSLTSDYSNRAYKCKRKASNMSEKKSEEAHPLDTFFLLMSSTIKTFTPADQHVVKNAVFALVSEMEAKYLNLNTTLETISPQKVESPSPTSSYLCHTSPGPQLV